MTEREQTKLEETLKSLTHLQRLIPDLKKSLEELRLIKTQTRTNL